MVVSRVMDVSNDCISAGSVRYRVSMYSKDPVQAIE